MFSPKVIEADLVTRKNLHYIYLLRIDQDVPRPILSVTFKDCEKFFRRIDCPRKFYLCWAPTSQRQVSKIASQNIE